MKKFCEDLRKYATKIINYEKKEMIPLTIEEKKNIAFRKLVIYAKKNSVPITMIENTIKSEIIVITLENIVALFITFVI